MLFGEKQIPRLGCGCWWPPCLVSVVSSPLENGFSNAAPWHWSGVCEESQLPLQLPCPAGLVADTASALNQPPRRVPAVQNFFE